MAAKWGKKGKQVVGGSGSVATVTDNDRSDRISNKLEHVMVVENKPKLSPYKRLIATIKKNRLAVLVIVGVILLGIVAAVVFLRKDPPPQPRKAYISSEGVAIRHLQYDQLNGDVQNLVFNKKYSSAVELINFQDDARDEKHQLLLMSVYVNQGKHDQALNVLLGMEQSNVGEKWKIQRNIGNTYEQLKDKKNALVYYKKALETLKQTDGVPVKDDEIFFLGMDIKRVEK